MYFLLVEFNKTIHCKDHASNLDKPLFNLSNDKIRSNILSKIDVSSAIRNILDYISFTISSIFIKNNKGSNIERWPMLMTDPCLFLIGNYRLNMIFFNLTNQVISQ